jgi:Flp pilus assembly protein TadG
MLLSKVSETYKRISPRTRQRGHAVVEVSLMAPWIFFLFMGVLDFGFYAYSAISVENAARVAAIYTSSGGSGTVTDSTGACYYVLQELQRANNIGTGVTTCAGGTSPVTVTAAAATVNGTAGAQVTVTYKSPNMIPIPGLTGSYTLTRIVTLMQ